MPLYDYKCLDCGPFEKWLHLDQLTQPIQCPSCDSEEVSRIFSPPMVLSSGRVSTQRSEDPQVVQRAAIQESKSNKTHYSQAGGRPWMVSH